MNRDKNFEIRILKIMLLVYIILAILLAGLNYSYANQSDSSIACRFYGSYFSSTYRRAYFT